MSPTLAVLSGVLTGLSALVALPGWGGRGQGKAVWPVLSTACLALAALALTLAGTQAWPPAVAAVLGTSAGVAGGGPVAALVLRLASPVTEPQQPAGSATRTPASAEQVLRGGTWIGALERAGIVAALLAGWPQGLLLVLGVKGLGRYPELRYPGAAERFIIGTMVSVLWAAAAAGVTRLAR